MAAHQLDFCPYSGFWKKMAMVDIFDIDIYTQWQKKFYGSRVQIGYGDKMEWWNMPNEGSTTLRICDVKLKYFVDWQTERFETLRKIYEKAPFWNKYSERVKDIMMGSKYEYIWQLSWAFLIFMKEALKIETPVSIARPLVLKTTDALIELCQIYGADEYLSGKGGMDYIEKEKFDAAGIKLGFVEHQITYSGSALHLLFNEENPLEIIMK